MNALGLAGAHGRRQRFAGLRLWLHRRWFNRRHYWVTSLNPDVVKGTWCFECGTTKGHDYGCDTENRLRRQCEPFGDYPNCIEVVEALLFVRHPDVDKATLCAWCETAARNQLY